MIIEKIYIKNFGKLSDLALELSDGINLIEGDNESGKSTLCAFIKFIFYGLSAKGEKGSLPERAKYLSWSENECSGYINVRADEKRYRITRVLAINSRGAYSEEVRVVDLDTNSTLAEITDPAEYFIGVPEDVFTRSCFASENPGDRAKNAGFDLRESIENILFSADETMNTKKALKKIDDARIELLYKNKKGGRIFDLRNHAESLFLRLGDARQASKEIDEKKCQSEEIRRTILEKDRIRDQYDAQIRHTDALRRLSAIERCKASEHQLDRAKAALALFECENSHNGYIPGRDYSVAAQSAATEYSFIEDEIGKVSSEISDERTKLSSLEKAIPDTDTEELAQALNDLSLRKRKCTIFTVLCFIIAALAALGAVILFNFDISIAAAAICAGVFVSEVVFAIILLAKGAKLKKKRLELLRAFGCESEKLLPARIREVLEARSKARSLSEYISSLEKKRASLEDRKTRIFDSASALLSRWGKECRSCDDIRMASSDASDAADKHSALHAQVELCEKAHENVRIAYTDEEEASLREQLESDGIQGELSGEEYAEASRRRNFAADTARMLRDRLVVSDAALANMIARAESPEALEEELAQTKAEEKAQIERYKALMLAYEKLELASNSLRERIAPTLSRSASRFMESATAGKYATIGVDRSLSLEYTSEDSLNRDIDYMSAGTKDLAYLSLRLALAELLLSDKKVPLVFDESFIRQDEGRLCASLRAIAAFSTEGYQSIILTSHSREEEALGAICEHKYIRIE